MLLSSPLNCTLADPSEIRLFVARSKEQHDLRLLTRLHARAADLRPLLDERLLQRRRQYAGAELKRFQANSAKLAAFCKKNKTDTLATAIKKSFT
jgi:hypothetical protein